MASDVNKASPAPLYKLNPPKPHPPKPYTPKPHPPKPYTPTRRCSRRRKRIWWHSSISNSGCPSSTALHTACR